MINFIIKNKNKKEKKKINNKDIKDKDKGKNNDKDKDKNHMKNKVKIKMKNQKYGIKYSLKINHNQSLQQKNNQLIKLIATLIIIIKLKKIQV